jgi:light-regulated signal transduction histidine kinase (bacteriophytochrome)
MMEDEAQKGGALGVTLENCDAEPIHIPGMIQPHGALLAFDDAGQLVGWSANAPELLRMTSHMGTHVSALLLDRDAEVAIESCLAQSEELSSATLSEEIKIEGGTFDLIVHRHAGRLIAEFERREQSADEVAAFALRAHRSIDRVRRQKTVVGLLETAVRDIRSVTGFDRVMAYRFRHDESGDVVAEACNPSLEPYLGRRYPASDIPSQARRLYTINTLRLIADVGYQPVAVFGRPGEPPIDMSHCVLRSVSPIHVEYLQNMGVGASMSISLVINGRLWGLIACHHMGPKMVPHSIRMACDVLAQVMSSTLQSLEASAQGVVIEQAAIVRTRLVTEFLQADDVMGALALHREAICQSLGAEALVISRASSVITYGTISDSLSNAIVESLPATSDALIERTALADWPQALQPLLGRWVGLLALHFDPAAEGWLIALRPEQIETVRWGGRPEKNIKIGPLGPRLTPRGSFVEWQETVRGRAEPWDSGHRTLARQLLAELHRAANTRHAEIERARTHLIAMLGHDLRDPLNSISMAATVLERGGQGQKLGQRIQASSGRMQRLISQALDMSRVQGGAGLSIKAAPTNLAQLITDIVEEMRTAHPATTFDVDMPGTVMGVLDPDRFGQIIANLLSNARHHGEVGSPVHLTLSSDETRALIHVRNRGEPIPGEIANDLFSPFKRHAVGFSRNRSGLGLGLYIAQQIAVGHGGSIEYRYDEPYVVFIVDVPLQGPEAANVGK